MGLIRYAALTQANVIAIEDLTHPHIYVMMTVVFNSILYMCLVLLIQRPLGWAVFGQLSQHTRNQQQMAKITGERIGETVCKAQARTILRT